MSTPNPTPDPCAKVSAAEAAKTMGISRRAVYDLATEGKLPHYRIGRRIVLEAADIREYLLQCRSTATKKRIVGGLSLTAVCQAKGESELTSAFLKLGAVPRQTPLTGKKRRASTPSPPAPSALRLVSKTP